MKAEITKEQAYYEFLRGHSGLTPDNGTACALAAHSLGKRSGLSCADGVISALQSLGFVFEGEAKAPEVTTIQAYNWLRKYYEGSATTVDIIKTARGHLALHIATWEANGEVAPHLYCQIGEETEHEIIAEMLGDWFQRCDHPTILAQMAKEPTEVV